MDFEYYETHPEVKGVPQALATLAYIVNIISLVCVLILFLTFYIFWRGPKAPKTIPFEHKLVVVLAANDLLQAINNIQSWAHILQTKGKWQSADAACQVDGFFHVLTGWLQITTITMMCIALYIRIVRNRQIKWPELYIVIGLWVLSAFIASIPLWGTSFASYEVFPWWCMMKKSVSQLGVLILIFIPLLIMYMIMLALYSFMSWHVISVFRQGVASTVNTVDEMKVVQRFMSFIIVMFIVYMPTLIYHSCDLFEILVPGSVKESALSFLVILGHGSSGLGNFFVYGMTDNLKHKWHVLLYEHKFFQRYLPPPKDDTRSSTTSSSAVSASATTANSSASSSSSSNSA